MFGPSTSQALAPFAGPRLLPLIQALRHNSYGTPSLVSDVLCTRLQLFLLHGLKQTAGALSLAVHVVHVSELTLHMTLERPSLSPQRSAAVLVELSPGSTVDPPSNCRGAELQFQAVDVN